MFPETNIPGVAVYDNVVRTQMKAKNVFRIHGGASFANFEDMRIDIVVDLHDVKVPEAKVIVHGVVKVRFGLQPLIDVKA